ncbi:MAG: peptidylprolyl isomerase [Bacteroidota bacterium]|jgi:peptidyl-prolyl cis-trans isomerase B (cyclophilin B)
MKKLLLSFILATWSVVALAQGIDKPQYQIVTHRAGTYLGTINIELFPLIAPLHTQNFDSLVNEQFFDSTAFHRVVPGFVIQGGDPNTISGPISTWGQGQPWQQTVPAEFNAVRHVRGILGAARDNDPNSANSQFYICVANSTFLDGNYTVYGKVTSGMNIVDTIVASPRNANDVPLQKIEMFVTYTGVNDSIPTAPTLNSPANGATGILNTQQFTFSNVPGAVLYTLQLSTDVNFSTINHSVNTGGTSAIVSNLMGSTNYYWRVIANNGGHESPPSSPRSFTSATAATTLIFPADSALGVSTNPVFQWSPVTNATSYTLQVSTSATFTTQTMVYNTVGISSTSQQVTGLNPNTLYYWRVRTANGTEQGFYSPKFVFSTLLTTIDESALPFQLLQLYPNPTHDQLILVVDDIKIDILSAILKDMKGKTVLTQSIDTREKQHQIHLHNIPQGAYLLELKSAGGSINRKVIKL